MNKSIKINNRKHNELVQDILFKLGYEWSDGQTYVYCTGRYINIRPATDQTMTTCGRPIFDVIRLKDLKQMETE